MKCAPSGSKGGVRGRKRQGIAAVELAVLAPFLATLFVITVDFARVFYYQMVLNNCARNGAMFGANLPSYQENGSWVTPDNTIAGATIADGTGLSPALNKNQVTTSYATGSDGNKNITVTINYTFSTLTSFTGFGTSVNLTATAKMRAYQ